MERDEGGILRVKSDRVRVKGLTWR
jgi:hypothetical protein